MKIYDKKIDDSNYFQNTISGNDVNFTSTPMLQRHPNQQLLVIGCNYTSARNRSLTDYFNITINGTEPSPTPWVATRRVWNQILPLYLFTYFIGICDFQCVAQFGEETFRSEKSILYLEPGAYIFNVYNYGLNFFITISIITKPSIPIGIN